MTFQEILEEAGYEPYAYSGRFMYGKRCVAVDLNNGRRIGDLIADINTVCDIQDINQSEFDAIFRDMTTDSMGLGIVVYFPCTPFLGDEENND